MGKTHEEKAVMTIKSIDGGQFEGVLAEPIGGAVYGDNVGEVLDKAATVVRAYKAVQSHESRIAEIDKQIRQLEIERDALASAEPEHLPIYSLLDKAALALYAVNTRGVDLEYINWYEARFNVNIVSICLLPSPFNNRYGSELIWDWHILPNEDGES